MSSWLEILLATKPCDRWQRNFSALPSTIDSKLPKHGQLRWPNGHIASTKHIGTNGTSSTFTSCPSTTANCEALALKLSTTVRILKNRKCHQSDTSWQITNCFRVLSIVLFVEQKASMKTPAGVEKTFPIPLKLFCVFFQKCTKLTSLFNMNLW